jgi:hypothetical protein
MNHPLDGARLKVIRAQEHLDSLKAEIAMYLKGGPYAVVAHDKSDPGSTISALQPPLRLSTVVGDVVVNARASLDYIIFQLARKYFVPPFDPATADRNTKTAVTFPIYVAGEHGYATGIKRLSDLLKPAGGRDIPTVVVKEIEASQTHNCGSNTLGWLHHLVNTDKHRMPLLTIGRLKAGTVSAQLSGTGNVEVIVDNTPIAQGISVTSFIVPHGQAERITVKGHGVKMNIQPTVVVTFQDVLMPRIPVDVALEQIVETVGHVVPRFDDFFV